MFRDARRPIARRVDVRTVTTRSAWPRIATPLGRAVIERGRARPAPVVETNDGPPGQSGGAGRVPGIRNTRDGPARGWQERGVDWAVWCRIQRAASSGCFWRARPMVGSYRLRRTCGPNPRGTQGATGCARSGQCGRKPMMNACGPSWPKGHQLSGSRLRYTAPYRAFAVTLGRSGARFQDLASLGKSGRTRTPNNP